MTDRERMDWKMLAASLRAAATKLERAVAVIEAAEAAEALVARCGRLLPGDAGRAPAGGVMQGAGIPGDRSPQVDRRVRHPVPIEVAAICDSAVFDESANKKGKDDKKSTVARRPPW